MSVYPSTVLHSPKWIAFVCLLFRIDATLALSFHLPSELLLSSKLLVVAACIVIINIAPPISDFPLPLPANAGSFSCRSLLTALLPHLKAGQERLRWLTEAFRMSHSLDL